MASIPSAKKKMPPHPQRLQTMTVRSDERRYPTREEGTILVQRMFKLLGSKSRHHDQLEDWMEHAYDRWLKSGLTWEKFAKIVEWAVTENVFTVQNLRVAKNPGESLFDRQW